MRPHGQWWMNQVPGGLAVLNVSLTAPNDRCLKQLLLRKCYELPSHGRCLHTGVRRRRMPGALHRVGYSLVVSLGDLGKPWFQNDHWRRTKYTVVSNGICQRWVYSASEMSKPSGGYMEWAISHRSPMSYLTLISSYCLVGWGVWLETGARAP